MTVGDLKKILSQFPDNDEVDWMLFSRLTPRRGNAVDGDIMIRRSRHNCRTAFMINLPKNFENDIIGEYERMKKVCPEFVRKNYN